MTELRLRFEKSGKAVYLSHLDLMRTLQRIFKRADLELKYSDGFNPHPRIFIAVPLSLGYSSICELVDIEIEDEHIPVDIIKKLNDASIEGIKFYECYKSDVKFKNILWLRYEMELTYKYIPDDACDKIKSLFEREVLTVTKKSKRKTEETNILPGIKGISISASDNNRLIISADLSNRPEMVLNPVYIVSAITKYLNELTPYNTHYRRIENLSENFEIFR